MTFKLTLKLVVKLWNGRIVVMDFVYGSPRFLNIQFSVQVCVVSLLWQSVMGELRGSRIGSPSDHWTGDFRFVVNLLSTAEKEARNAAGK